MSRTRFQYVGLALLAVIAPIHASSSLYADDAPASVQHPLASAGADAAPHSDQKVSTDSARMTTRIDELLAADWAAVGITPAERADDAEFLRRASLDLTGCVPTVAEVRNFLADTDEQKRTRLVDRLLSSPLHAEHLATTWRHMMVPRGSTVDGFDGQAGLQKWLRAQFAKNLRYDQLVAELLVATGTAQDGPGLFFTAFDLKPEELAANTARMFLGVQIECAQCHDHPFDRWTQRDFWGYAAFFARVGRGGDMQSRSGLRLVDREVGEVMLPGSAQPVVPRYPRGEVPAGDDSGTRRQQLGIWMVSRDNPFLAPAAVNRAWAHLFGQGLVEPVDDLSERNPASHPQLFQELSAYFIASSFDFRNLLRTLANTRAYQLASRAQGNDTPRPETVARMLVKTLTPEQFYDSLQRASLAEAAGSERGVTPGFDAARQAFVEKMQTPRASHLDYDAGVAQVLRLSNGPEVTAATSGDSSGLLAALDVPVITDAERVEILFLATLSRPPTANEMTRSLALLARGPSENVDRATALGDILWALVNSAEFSVNH